MRAIPWLLFFCVCAIGIVLIPKIGPSWDEPDNIYSGGQYARFFQLRLDPAILTSRQKSASIFSDQIDSLEPSLARYPPIPNYVGTVLALLAPVSTGAHIIIAFHLATLLFFALLVATVYRFGILLGLPVWGSLFAAAATFLYPTLFGYGLSNIKDTAQVSLFTLSLYYLMKGRFVKGSMFWGLALASKFNAIYVPIIWFFASNKRKFFVGVFIGLFTAFLVWPYLWFDPISRAVEVVRYFTTVGSGYMIFWNGVLYQVGVGRVLWWYPWANILLATPIPLLILVVIGVIREIREKRGFLLIWILVPTLRAFLPHAAFYDGMRHFLEILPAFMLLAAVGLTQLVKLVKLGKLGKTILAAVILGQLVYINVQYFPYSTGYLNAFARDPNTRFDRDIEALSVKEAMDYLHTTYGNIVVWSPFGGHLSWPYLRELDVYDFTSKLADSVIFVNKSSHITEKDFLVQLGPSYRLDHVIRRGNAIFGWVYRRKP